MRYFITVTEEGITLPTQMKPGRYEAVLIKEEDSENAGLISIKSLRRKYCFADKDTDALFSKLCNNLERAGFKYLDDFCGKDIRYIVPEVRNVGLSTACFIVAFCKKFAIDVIYPASKTGLIAYYQAMICENTEN